MIDPVVILGMASIGIAVLVAYTTHRERVRREWQVLAIDLAGDFTTGPPYVIRARYHDCDLTIAERVVSRGKSSQVFTDLTLAGGGIPTEVSVVPEKGLGRIFTTPDIRTGDAEFDGQMVVTGSPLVAAALLGKPVREILLGVAQGHRPALQLSDGALCLTLSDLAPVESIRRHLAHMGRILLPNFTIQAGQIPAKLLRNFQDEPNRSPALWLFQVLMEHFPDSPEAEQGLAAATTHKFADLWYAAALYALPVDPKRLRTAALFDQIREDIRQRAVEKLGEIGSTPENLDTLLTVSLKDYPEPLRLAAFQALGEIGTRECVEQLLPYTEGLFADGDVKTAARAAVAKIQSRLGDAGAGRITAVEPGAAEGAISSAGAGAGALAAAEREDGQ